MQRRAALRERLDHVDAERAPEPVQLLHRRGERRIGDVGELNRDQRGAERTGRLVEHGARV